MVREIIKKVIDIIKKTNICYIFSEIFETFVALSEFWACPSTGTPTLDLDLNDLKL